MTYQSNGFAALADPMRRRIMERLGRGGLPVRRIAEGLPISRPAVSQHLKVLKEAGLVSDEAAGTQRIYRIDPEGLGILRRWLDQFWGEALEAFAAEADREPEDTRQHDPEPDIGADAVPAAGRKPDQGVAQKASQNASEDAKR